MREPEFKEIEQDVTEREGSYKGLLKEALLTSKEDYEAIFKALPDIEKWIEPGSGHGLGPVLFAKLYPNRSAIGIEFEKPRYEASQALKLQEKVNNVQFSHNDLLTSDLPEGDTYFLYLPTGMVLDKILSEIGKRNSPVTIIAIESHGDFLPRLEKEKWLKKLREIPLKSPRHYPFAVVYQKVGSYRPSLHSESFLKKYLLIKDDSGEKWLGESFGLEWSRNNEFNLKVPPRTIKSQQVIRIFSLEELEKIYHFALYLRRLGELSIETEHTKYVGTIRKIFVSPCFKVEISTGQAVRMEADQKDFLRECSMLRILFGLLLLSSCSLGVVKQGGDKSYAYDSSHSYSLDELKTLAPQVITTSRRDPEKGKLDELFSSEQPPLKRIGILVFETAIQPTRSGLADEDLVYLSAQGKQILTENLLSIWEESLPILGENVDFVETSEIEESKAFKKHGMNVEDFILSKRDVLAPDDIFFLEKGKAATSVTVLNPRGMRDLSLAMVPATEMMGGPKFSEHAKHAVNEVAKELNLDAVIVVMSKLGWTVARTDKHSGTVFPEQAVIQIESSILIPFSSYHQRLKKLGEKSNLPKTNVAYRTYETKMRIPVKFSAKPEEQNFQSIEKELLTPVVNAYNDLTHMMQAQMIKDLNKTIK